MRHNKPGKYILSGSQNFLLLKEISQSLAGRVGIMRLLPLTYHELHDSAYKTNVDSFMLQGGYPRIYDAQIPLQYFFDSYIATYIERDVAGYINRRNIITFRNFLKLCAQNSGQLINVSRFATDLGVSRNTIDSWLSILEANYIIYRLHPYHTNARKRIVKTPKLYFYDTGLLCHLLGIKTPDELRDSNLRGAVFENLIVQETIKRYSSIGKDANLFFYRDDSKIEVDLLDASHNLEIAEIKSIASYKKGMDTQLNKIADVLSIASQNRFVVTRGNEDYSVEKTQYVAAHSWLMREVSNL